VPILVLTIVWAPEAVNPILFIVSAFFTLVTVLSRVGPFAWSVYVRRKVGTAAKNTHEGEPSVVTDGTSLAADVWRKCGSFARWVDWIDK